MPSVYKLLFASIGLCAVITSACSSRSFTGENKRQETNKAPAYVAPSPTLSPQPIGVPVPQQCGPQGVTTAILKTPTIYAQRSAQFLSFEMSLTDCFGKVMPLTSKTILFDIDSYSDELNGYAFTIKDENGTSLLTSGTHRLRSVDGSDLFGNTGNFRHFRTDSGFTVSPTSKKIIFSVDLSNRQLRPRLGPKDGQVPVYLRFAEATVSQQQVMLYGMELPGVP